MAGLMEGMPGVRGSDGSRLWLFEAGEWAGI